MPSLPPVPVRRTRAAVVSLVALAALVWACSHEEAPERPAPAASALAAPSVPPPATTDAAGARSAYEAGLDAAAQGRSAEAVAAYRRALELDPGFAQAEFALGCALVPTASLAVGATAEDPDPGQRAVKLGLDRRVLEEGIAHLARAAELEPGDARIAYWLGRALHVADRDAEAITALERALTLDPGAGQAEKRLGLIYLDQGEGERARAHLVRALELLPNDPGVPFHLGNLALEAQPEEARGFFERAIAIDPTFPWAHNNLALVLARLGDADGAERERAAYERWKAFDAELSAVVERASKRAGDAAAQDEAGEMLFGANRADEALRMFRRALALDPEDALAHLYCGILLRQGGELELARRHLETSSALAPEEVQPLVELARVAADLGDEARVTELAARLETLVQPGDPDAELLFARWLLERGRRDEAARRFEAVLAALPDSPEAKEGLARAREEPP